MDAIFQQHHASYFSDFSSSALNVSICESELMAVVVMHQSSLFYPHTDSDTSTQGISWKLPHLKWTYFTL